MQCRVPRPVIPCVGGKPEIGLSIMTSVRTKTCKPQTVASQEVAFRPFRLYPQERVLLRGGHAPLRFGIGGGRYFSYCRDENSTHTGDARQGNVWRVPRIF
jgi:hypothetical protein